MAMTMPMLSMLPLTPARASSMAGAVDELFAFLTVFCLLTALTIAGFIICFAVHYRRRPERPRGLPLSGSLPVEVLWVAVPTVIFLVIFYRGAKIYFQLGTPPPGAIEVYVVAKQWMWKFQHPEGPMEIDELHVPLGRDVKLIMTSEDAIHSFFVPAFRVKADVLPGRYTALWFRPVRAGTYHLFCAEYCGTNHAGMRGVVVVLPPAAYQAWQTLGRQSGSIASAGEKLFQQLACNTCHRRDLQGRGPVLDGVFGHAVPLRDGRTVVADESYLRESILLPSAKVVAGFAPIMPSFRGLLTEPQVLELIAYIKSLAPLQLGQGEPAP